MMQAKKIAEIIAASDNIVISSHTGPDGDAIGSVSALFMALKKIGKNVIAVLEAMPHRFHTIDGASNICFEIHDNFPAKTFIALDCGDKSRLGRFEKFFDSAEVRINIDHHSSNDFFGMHNYVVDNACAASELVYNILKALDEFDIDNRIASALYAGILYDTGGFRHSNVTSRTYFMAGELIDLGADFKAICNKILWEKRFEEIKILTVAFDKMKREFDGRLVWTSVTTRELEQANARGSDLDNVVDFCKGVEGAEIAVFFYQKAENEFKVSFRSEPGYDVSKIAGKFGGGGHKNAAGASYNGSLENLVAEAFKEISILLGGA